MKQNQLNKILSIGLLSALALTACGKQAFAPSTTSDSQTAAGNMNIPPKVDIVVGVSANGTMRNIYSTLQAEMQNFATGLQASGWDYRFVTISLAETPSASTQSVLGRVFVSNYDGNYASQGTWLSPYPGAVATNPGMAIDPTLFASSIQFPNDLYSQPNNGRETGLLNEKTFLNTSIVQSKFLRPDAMLAMITISNGEDRSVGLDGHWAGAWDGSAWVDDYTQFGALEANLKALKGGSGALVKVYDITAQNTTQCMGGEAWAGLHYQYLSQNMASSTSN